MDLNPNQAGKTGAPAERLVVLPWGKSLGIAMGSIRVRFLRSLITTLSLVFAISFFAYVRVNTDVANGFLASGEPRLREALAARGHNVSDTTGTLSTSPKQRWLVILSLLVCVVGIVNAQLMAVTERFREIGTMKCLGALNRFIVRLFLLEALMQGAAGALAGALLGAFFALAGATLRYGPAALTHLSLSHLALSLGVAMAIGCVLSVAGVLYPALAAARMQPVEAMRTEH